jgi:hypothetical protein
LLRLLALRGLGETRRDRGEAAASRASFRCISSVAIDFDFTAMRAPVRRAMSSTMPVASAAVAA